MKKISVAFIDQRLKNEFETLNDKDLKKFIKRAISDLEKNPSCGIKIPRKLWPTIYIKKYSITNLWKYDLPNAWRLIYTVETGKIEIMNIILEWMSHKEYEKRFRY